MRPFTRKPAPKWWLALAAQCEAKQTSPTEINSAERKPFVWPARNGKSSGPILKRALAKQTQQHCAYCDSWPLPKRASSIDHFRPKSKKKFPHLACDWNNLYFVCANCQGSKLSYWNEETHLLAPDEIGFTFHQYFVYDYYSGSIKPNPHANNHHRKRAKLTIQKMGLDEHAVARMMAMELYESRKVSGSIDIDSLPYRYLFE
jgi:uncharacterized protein (TIGR02646 family)